MRLPHPMSPPLPISVSALIVPDAKYALVGGGSAGGTLGLSRLGSIVWSACQTSLFPSTRSLERAD